MKALDRVIALPKHTLAATIFLSRLPLWRLMPDDRPDFRVSAQAFPLAGALIAIIPLAIACLATFLGASPPVVAGLLLGAMMLTTGALHEDGLADVADGFWGGHTLERKLAIMRDSAIGTCGTLSLIVVTGLRWAALSALFASDFWAAALAYIAIAALSRSAMLVPWHWLPAARPTEAPDAMGKSAAGLSARYGGPDGLAVTIATILSVPAILILGPTSLFVGILALAAITWLAHRHIGGHTGDVLGATQQLVELGLLLGLTLAI